MSIQPRKKPTLPPVANADAFIAGAPDAKPAEAAKSVYEKGVAKGNKRQISHTIDPELLREVDELAEKTGQARAALINLFIYRGIKDKDNIFDA